MPASIAAENFGIVPAAPPAFRLANSVKDKRFASPNEGRRRLPEKPVLVELNLHCKFLNPNISSPDAIVIRADGLNALEKTAISCYNRFNYTLINGAEHHE
jgi:hypothetical protein